MKTTFLLAAAAIAAAGATHAGGVTAPALDPQPQPQMRPVVVSQSDWTGAYGGASLGYGDSDLEIVEVDMDEIELDGVDISMDRLHRLKVRAGYDAGRALIYGVAGAAYGNLHVEVDDVDGFSGEDDGNDWGYVIGAGAEVLVSDRVSIGGDWPMRTSWARMKVLAPRRSPSRPASPTGSDPTISLVA